LNSVKNRKSLTYWLYKIHERVNKKLETTYGVTYNDVVEKYESYRAKCSAKKDKGCIVPLNKKAESYLKSSIDECSIISFDIAKQFIKYAKLRNIPDEHFYLINKCLDPESLKTVMDSKSQIWIDRNKQCRSIINKMRIDGVESIETEGTYKNLPTVQETILILMMCSNLTNDELEKTIKYLPYYYKNKQIVQLFA
jgi:hypothetical protein